MINILALLHIALSLLNNPQVQANPTLLAQANSFALEAVQLAEQSLTTANSTSTDASTTPITVVTPIVIPSVPVISTPVTTNTSTNQTLGAADQMQTAVVPILPSIMPYNGTSTAVFLLSGGMYDSLSVNVKHYQTSTEDTTEDMGTYPINGSFVVNNLNPDDRYSFIFTATTSGGSTSTRLHGYDIDTVPVGTLVTMPNLPTSTISLP